MSTDTGTLEGLRIERRPDGGPPASSGRGRGWRRWLLALTVLAAAALALGGWLARSAPVPVRVAVVSQAGGAAGGGAGGAVLNASG
jgi:hypothetical protein